MLVHLLHDAALLFGLTFLYGLVNTQWSRLRPLQLGLIRGVLFGLFGVMAMLNPVEIVPGVFYDARMVMVAIAGAFGGLTSAAPAAALIILTRTMIGGPGALSSSMAALFVMGLGVIFYELVRRKHLPLNVWTLLGLGFLSAVNLPLWTVTLPDQVRSLVLSTVFPVMLLSYPPMCAMLGLLLVWSRRQSELQGDLSRSEGLYRTIVEHISEGIVLTDAHERIVYLNHALCAMIGVKPEQLIGLPATDNPALAYVIEKTKVQQEITARHQGTLGQFELTARRPDGAPLPLLVSVVPLISPEGRYTGSVAVMADLTIYLREQEHEEALATAEKRLELLREFVTTTSHDFRTPLSIIDTSTYLLRRVTPPDHQRRLDIISEQVRQLDRVLEDFNEMARLERETQFDYRPIDLKVLLERIIGRRRPFADAKRQTLDYQPAADLPTIPGDETTLARALDGIISNAITYTPEQGSITITTALEGGTVIIRTRDTGIGLTNEDQARIFDHFYRADLSRSSTTGGAGLGLTIARRIIDLHQGSISVESTPGTGSTFTVRLPTKHRA